jgi:prepilin-type N-terminal cleavage/methylation domain-containing protein
MTRGRRGVSLIEMLVVVTIVALIAGVSFPSVTAGLDSIQLRTTSDSVVAFLNAGLTRAERKQIPVEFAVAIRENTLTLRSAEPGFVRTLELPKGISIQRVLPELPLTEEVVTVRNFVIYPGGTVPRIGIEVANSRGGRRMVRVDPKTGVPLAEIPQEDTR